MITPRFSCFLILFPQCVIDLDRSILKVGGELGGSVPLLSQDDVFHDSRLVRSKSSLIWHASQRGRTNSLLPNGGVATCLFWRTCFGNIHLFSDSNIIRSYHHCGSELSTWHYGPYRVSYNSEPNPRVVRLVGLPDHTVRESSTNGCPFVNNVYHNAAFGGIALDIMAGIV